MRSFVRREETQTDQCHLTVDVFVLQTYKDKFAMALISLLNMVFLKHLKLLFRRVQDMYSIFFPSSFNLLPHCWQYQLFSCCCYLNFNT